MIDVESESFKRYVKAASQYISKDHLLRFLKAKIILNEKQLEFCMWARRADNDDGPFEIGYGGARGGGKSFGALSQLLADDCQRHKIKALYLRLTGVAGKEKFKELRGPILGNLEHKYKEYQGTLEFPNGSLVILGHFKNETDVDRYLGLEYDVILVEEATLLTESKIQDIKTCARTSLPDWRPRVYYVTNPLGVGHGWFTRNIYHGLTHRTAFVHSLTLDNRMINEEYAESLKDLKGNKLKAWALGDFTIKAGNYFDCEINTNIDTKSLDEYSYLWGALDHGVSHWAVFYIAGKKVDGTIHIIDEFAYKGRLAGAMADSVTLLLNEIYSLNPADLVSLVCGADCFAKQPISGLTVADLYKSRGFEVTIANTDRLQGADVFLRYLASGKLVISEKCTGLLHTLPLLQRDPKRPNDVKKWNTSEFDYERLTGDDFYDAARYLVLTQPVNVEIPDALPPEEEEYYSVI